MRAAVDPAVSLSTYSPLLMDFIEEGTDKDLRIIKISFQIKLGANVGDIPRGMTRLEC